MKTPKSASKSGYFNSLLPLAMNTDTKVFLISTFVATIFPICFSLLFHSFNDSSEPIGNIFAMLAILSTMHVALTLFFYTDLRYVDYFKKNAKFYFLLPLFITVGNGVIYFFLDSTDVALIFFIYHAWLLFHYGRQNYGLFCFVGIATKESRTRLVERLLLHLSPLAGILGAIRLVPQFDQFLSSDIQEFCLKAGLGLVLLILCLLSYTIYLHIRKGMSIIRSIFLITLVLFYLPTFLFENYFPAVTSYAIAHALQYFIFVYYIAADHKQGSLHGRLFTLVGLAIGGWMFIVLTREYSLWGRLENFVAGASLGITMAHFVVDAGVWKLSQPFQRSAVKEGFKFLFD